MTYEGAICEYFGNVTSLINKGKMESPTQHFRQRFQAHRLGENAWKRSGNAEMRAPYLSTTYHFYAFLETLEMLETLLEMLLETLAALMAFFR